MAADKPRLTCAEYRAIDEASEQRCEFFEGEVYAMAGGTVAHANVRAGVLAALASVLDGPPCRPRGSDARIDFPADGDAAYPDIHVVCRRTEHAPADADATINPVVTADERIESFVRNDDHSWTRRVHEAGAQVPLVAGAAIAVDKMCALQRAELAAG